MTEDIMLINRGFSDVNPLVAGYEACEPEHFYGPCARDYYVIHYVVSGMGVFKTGDKSYSLTAGEMFLFSPRETIFYQADKEKPWTYIWIGFTTSFDVTEIFNRHVISARECGTIFPKLPNVRGLNSSENCIFAVKYLKYFLSG